MLDIFFIFRPLEISQIGKSFSLKSDQNKPNNKSPNLGFYETAS